MLASYVTIPQAWDGVPTRDAVSFLVGLRSVRASNAVYLVPISASSDVIGTSCPKSVLSAPCRGPAYPLLIEDVLSNGGVSGHKVPHRTDAVHQC